MPEASCALRNCKYFNNLHSSVASDNCLMLRCFRENFLSFIIITHVNYLVYIFFYIYLNFTMYIKSEFFGSIWRKSFSYKKKTFLKKHKRQINLVCFSHFSNEIIKRSKKNNFLNIIIINLRKWSKTNMRESPPPLGEWDRERSWDNFFN